VPFVTVGVLGIFSSLYFLTLEHDAGEEVSGRRTEIAVTNVTPEPAAAD
jgi:hypothetical protein